MDAETPPSYKVILVGSTSVGKRSLIARWTGCEASYITPTDSRALSVSFSDVDWQLVWLRIWDTPSERHFRQEEERHFKSLFTDAHAAALVYDVTAPASFFDLVYWRDQIAAAFPRLPLMVIGNKIDQGSIVSLAEARCWAENLGMSFAQVSVLNDEGIHEALLLLLELFIREREQYIAHEQSRRSRQLG